METIMSKVNNILQDVKPALRKFLSGEHMYPMYESSNNHTTSHGDSNNAASLFSKLVRNLKIPLARIPGAHTPSLLLHDLEKPAGSSSLDVIFNKSMSSADSEPASTT